GPTIFVFSFTPADGGVRLSRGPGFAPLTDHRAPKPLAAAAAAPLHHAPTTAAIAARLPAQVSPQWRGVSTRGGRGDPSSMAFALSRVHAPCSGNGPAHGLPAALGACWRRGGGVMVVRGAGAGPPFHRGPLVSSPGKLEYALSSSKCGNMGHIACCGVKSLGCALCC
ncbi:unnamed protein product, partial [Ectocarpus sp. 12 AP-2014]